MFHSYHAFHAFPVAYSPIEVPVDEWEPHRKKVNDMTTALMWANKTQAVVCFRGYGPNGKGFMDWGIKLETVVRAGTEESLTLFRTDSTEYRSASVRWMQSSSILERSLVVSQWGLADDCMTNDAIVEAMKLHRDAWAYAAQHNISLDFRRAFYEYYPFDELRTEETIKSYGVEMYSHFPFVDEEGN